MNHENPIRVLVADDHPIWREGLAQLIERRPDMTVVAEASNGREAITLFEQHRPDVTLMDLRMPEMGGVEAVTQIRQAFPTARIIALTTFDGDEDVYQALHAGAVGYLLKDVPWEELIQAIRNVHAGKKYIPADVAYKLTERVQTMDLTPRELEVLQQIALGKSNQEIAAALFIVEGTVKAHITNIFDKLRVGDRTQAVMIAVKRGILHME